MKQLFSFFVLGIVQFIQFSSFGNTNMVEYEIPMIPSTESRVWVSDQKWGKATLFILDKQKKPLDTLYSGSQLAWVKRDLPHAKTAFLIQNWPDSTAYLRWVLTSDYSILRPQNPVFTAMSYLDFIRLDSARIWWQATFLGIILVMALYNLIIFWVVRDLSYGYYVLSMVGLGLYFAFYYGFGIEWLWPNSPRWDIYAFAFIVPGTNLSRIFFTQTYLPLSRTDRFFHRWAIGLIGLCFFIWGLSLLSWFAHWDILNLIVDLVGLLGILVFLYMLFAGWYAWSRGYRPARYFMMANGTFIVGGILFILQEIHWISATSLTTSAVQIGFVAQMVLFSLGLSSRLQAAQMQLAHVALERERERKLILEEQSQVLSEKVAEQTANLRELNLQKDKILSIISHDLRNPIVSLGSFMNILIHHQEKLSAKEKQTLFQKAGHSLHHLNQLLSNLLLWSQAQWQQVSFHPQPLDLATLVQEVLEVESFPLEMKQLHVTQMLPSSGILYGDPHMVQFILRNLVGNAIKFSYPQGVIRISGKASAEGMEVCIQDEGIGIDPAQWDVYRKKGVFTVARGTAKEKGTGLGLLLCQEFMEKHEGSLRFESNRGTSVYCFFPAPKV